MESAVYRADIDGLRGIAVLSVIGFHVFPQWVRGGYVGVDVFFVISGYLISSIILNDLETDRFTFAGFYARRIKRIFPALIVLLALCYVWGSFVLFADDYRQFARHMAGSAAFVANFFLWQDIWYFDSAVDRKPLLHLWSLGIEEQFYLVWPLLLYLAWRRRVNPLWPTVLILATSFLASAYTVRHDASAAFYSPLTRVWELAVGAVLACAARLPTWRPHLSPRAADLAAIAGLALVVTSMFSIGQAKAYLGLRTALPTLGAALLIAAGSGAVVNRQFLSRPSLVWVGLISYPLYLWHWPLLSFTTIAQSRSPSNVERTMAIAVSVLLAWLTYRLIERPIRFGPRRRATVPVLCALLIVVAGVGAATYWQDGLPGRRLNLTDQARFIEYYQRLQAQGLAKAYLDGCDFLDWKKSHRTKLELDPDCTRPGARGTVLLWGDSYAQALSLGIRELLPADVRLAQIATSSCPPSEKNLNDPEDERCSRSNNRALAAIGELTPAIVILAQRTLHETTDWSSLARRIRGLGGKRVILIGPTPLWRPSLPLVIASKDWNGNLRRVRAGLDSERFAADAALKQRFTGTSDPEYVSIIDHLCNGDGCVATLPGGGFQDLIVVDEGHLSPKGSVFVVKQILGRVLSGL